MPRVVWTKRATFWKRYSDPVSQKYEKGPREKLARAFD
jgi:hypothetical protein